LILCFVIVLHSFVIAPPRAFPSGTIVTIEQGDTLDAVTQKFADASIISSSLAFELLVRLSGTASTLSAGPYRFSRATNVFGVWWAVTHGDFGLPPAKITIPEGMTNAEVASR